MRRSTRTAPFWVGVLWLLAVDLSAKPPRHVAKRRDVLEQAPPVVEVSTPVEKPGIGAGIQLIPVEGAPGAKFLR